ncbi:L,D-transpeptidase family protein [Noviherbaspirillum aerium]|uniref:L,D-transpeptidase family protein n=1 Tax=Noviherbaspirillum aerium TaxID=2588497 RepID=UPI00124BFFA1|nr:L,D-transpeptidase family protein [Noviherbaspirillum aerium]
MLAHMDLDGQRLHWNGVRFKATTGFKGFQHPTHQCTPEYGPIPEGVYKVFLWKKGLAKDDGNNRCNLAPTWGIQQNPRGEAAGKCEPFWANWGQNRARMEPADVKTQQACKPSRGGFYLHDSTKGYSHGCIEVEGTFFHSLRHYAGATRQSYLVLRVKYVSGRPTNGGTRA